MDDRSSDTAQTHGSQNPPGSASNQNSEEPGAPTGSEDPGAHRRPSQPDDREGGAGEDSQATGNPAAAG